MWFNSRRSDSVLHLHSGMLLPGVLYTVKKVFVDANLRNYPEGTVLQFLGSDGQSSPSRLLLLLNYFIGKGVSRDFYNGYVLHFKATSGRRERIPLSYEHSLCRSVIENPGHYFDGDFPTTQQLLDVLGRGDRRSLDYLVPSGLDLDSSCVGAFSALHQARRSLIYFEMHGGLDKDMQDRYNTLQSLERRLISALFTRAHNFGNA